MRYPQGMSSSLFTPLVIRSVEIKNRLWVSPMCQYSSIDGHPTDWHLVHLGSRAVGGAGLVMVEATAVSPEGRITPDDSGIWSDEHIASFRRLTGLLKEHGAICGIQLAHAGRKASTPAPWADSGTGPLGPNERGWETVAPSALSFRDGEPRPKEMTIADTAKVIADFRRAAERSLEAGFDVVELHMAHGYLLHEFLAPLSNRRNDSFGGTLENRMRLPLAITEEVRRIWPERLPLFARLSVTDWSRGAAELNVESPEVSQTSQVSQTSWDLAQSIVLSKALKDRGVDLIDCSSGGNVPKAEIPVGPGYQVPFAEAIRREVGILTAAVGMITESAQADAIIREEKADAVFVARQFLRDPYFALHAARELGAACPPPKQYGRA